MSEAKKSVNLARLVDWVEGRLGEDEARAVEEAVERADADTLAKVAWLRKFRAATDNVLIGSPPRELRNALVDVFEAHARARQSTGFVRRMIAGLAFDSYLQPSTGLRAAGAQRSRRQLIYHADGLDLMVNLLARGLDNDLDLDGQVLPREGEEPGLFSVQLLRDGDETALTVVDEVGSFAFERIPPGSYELVLSADRVEILVAPLDVGL